MIKNYEEHIKICPEKPTSKPTSKWQDSLDIKKRLYFTADEKVLINTPSYKPSASTKDQHFVKEKLKANTHSSKEVCYNTIKIYFY